MPTKVNSLLTNSRLLIALHSPHGLLETGLNLCPSEKNRGKSPLRCRIVHSLQSGFFRKNRETRACFAYFGVRGSGISLQLRLAGGESGIRTCITLSNSRKSRFLFEFYLGRIPPSRTRMAETNYFKITSCFFTKGSPQNPAKLSFYCG